MKYAWIRQHVNEFGVSSMCRFIPSGAQVQVSRSAYYDWQKRLPTTREGKDSELTRMIQDDFTKSRSTYGTRRIRQTLIKRGLSVSRRRIGRLMTKAGLSCKTKRKFKATTNSKHNLPVADNHLNRQFTVSKPNQVYVGDTSAPCGYHLYPYSGRLAIFGSCYRLVFAASGGLVNRRTYAGITGQ